jgi:hypothetical protein
VTTTKQDWLADVGNVVNDVCAMMFLLSS